jgi:DNA-binding NtrC family response regulator
VSPPARRSIWRGIRCRPSSRPNGLERLKAHNGSIKDTMAALGLPRKTLYDKMKKYRLARENYK